MRRKNKKIDYNCLGTAGFPTYNIIDSFGTYGFSFQTILEFS